MKSAKNGRRSDYIPPFLNVEGGKAKNRGKPDTRMGCSPTAPNNALQLTAYSLRYAAASGSS